MNVHTPTAAEQAASVKALKAKFYGSGEVKNAVLNQKKTHHQENQMIKDLSATIEALKRVVASKDEEIARIQEQLSALSSTVLCQAHMLVDSYRSASDEGGKVGRRSPRAIIEARIARDFPDFSFFDIIGKNRGRELLEARKACVVDVYKERADMSFPDIARVFRKNHTTIMHHVEKAGAKR